MEPGIAQRKLGGGGNAIGQDRIDRPSLVPDEHADLERRPGVGGRRCAPSPGAGSSTGRPSSSTYVPPSSSAYPMTRVGSSRAAARRSRNVVPSARSPRSITRRVSASRDHPPQRRSMASAAVLRMSTIAERIRAGEVERAGGHADRDQGERHGHRARHQRRPPSDRAAAVHRSRTRGPAAVSAATARRAASKPTRPSGGATNGERVAGRDDDTLGRPLESAGRIRHEEMHEEAEIDAARERASRRRRTTWYRLRARGRRCAGPSGRRG